MWMVRSFARTAFLLTGVLACAREPTLQPKGPRVIAMVGQVSDVKRMQPLSFESPLQADAAFKIDDDSALTVLLENGCVAHITGPTVISFAALVAAMPDPCRESVDDQITLLAGVAGAKATLRERTAAAGQDKNSIQESPVVVERQGAKAERLKPEQAAPSRNAPVADGNLKQQRNPTSDAPEEDGDFGKRQSKDNPNNQRRESPPPIVPPTPPAANMGGVPPTGLPNVDVLRDAEGASAVEPTPMLQGVLVRSRALEKMLNDPERASCRAALVANGPVAIHARIVDGKIVGVMLAQGGSPPCDTALIGQPMRLPNGVAVARLQP
jgi:hypothetical protein